MSSVHRRLAHSNTRSRIAQTNAVIIAEINAAIRVSSASIGVRGVPNREKRAWCANIELEGSKGLAGFSFSLFFFSFSFSLSNRVRPFRYRHEYPFRIGAKNTAVVADTLVQLRGVPRVTGPPLEVSARCRSAGMH